MEIPQTPASKGVVSEPILPAPGSPSWIDKAERLWKKNHKFAIFLVGFFAVVSLWASVRPFWPGISIGVLATVAAIMSIREMSMPEKVAWLVILILLATAEIRSIIKNEEEQNVQLATTSRAIQSELNNTSALLGLSQIEINILQSLSRNPQLDPSDIDALAKAWGKASSIKSKAVEGASPSQAQPPQIQNTTREISAEKLGKQLAMWRPAAATIINDGTNEAGNFAKQLEIGLRMAGWQVGGDNVKMGDPVFFPDSLTLEVSFPAASPDDRSDDAARRLLEALREQEIQATIRFTDLKFPPNFIRIKVRGKP
jgi:hypothetical protein